ncbi:hypothetical protein C0J52_07029 [Blattella germanica]|nr:hypothetical protein C0J52_07029 [Blattella germanica]
MNIIIKLYFRLFFQCMKNVDFSLLVLVYSIVYTALFTSSFVCLLQLPTHRE